MPRLSGPPGTRARSAVRTARFDGGFRAMSAGLTRRRFLHAAGAGWAASGLPGLAGILPAGPVRADEAKVTPDIVRFGPDIEPVVRLIEETPRDRCVAALVDQLRGGLPYRRFLAAVFLAAVRKGDSHHS